MSEIEKYKDFKFTNKDEEILYLKNIIAERENNEPGITSTTEQKEILTSEVLKKYETLPERQSMSEKVALPSSQITTISLGLSPEVHDDNVQKVIDVFIAEGLSSAFAVLDEVGDEHLKDDFHRFLVQYVLNFEDNSKFGPFKEIVESSKK